MENHKNQSCLDECGAETVQQNSLGSLMGEENSLMATSYSSPNYAQELIDYVTLSLKNSGREALFSKPYKCPKFYPAPNSQGGLFVTDQEELGRNVWRILSKIQGEQYGNGTN